MKEKLQAYLQLYLQPRKEKRASLQGVARSVLEDAYVDYECCQSISNYIEENKEEDTFQTKLFKLIDERNMKDSDVYNKVNIDRRLFSKIRSNKDYHPSKETIILLGIALELSEEELEQLLEKASYSLPMNTEYDLIIRFCFKEKIYDVMKINEFLYDYHCKTLNE